MQWLASLIGGTLFQGIGTLFTSVLGPLVGFYTNKDNLEEKGFEVSAATDAQVQIAYLQAQVQVAQIQASQNQWWGARMVMVSIAGLMTIHLGAVTFDCIPWFGHVVGSWQIAALPGPIAGWEGQIVLSFFILTPAAPAISAMASWLHRK